MNTQLPRCTNCPAILPVEFYNKPALSPCPVCLAPLHVDVFPALFRPVTPGSAGEYVIVEGESSCFYHPQKKAVVPCASCGRFLCALCDLELNDQHLCPPCFEAGKKKGKIVSLQNQRTCYDRIALTLAAVPLVLPVFWFFMPATGAMAIFVCLRHWNSPASLVRSHKARFVVAMLLAVIQIAVSMLLFYQLFKA